MRLLFALVVLMSAFPLSAYAGGFFGDVFDSVGKIQLQQQLQLKNAIDQIEEAKRRQALDKAEKEKQTPPLPLPKVDSGALSKTLVSKSRDELLALSIEPNLCISIDCHGIDAGVVRNLINTVRSDKQIIIDLEIKQTQAIAAIGSTVIATLSLLISIAGFIRAGKAAKAAQSPTPQQEPPTSPALVGAGADRA